jgi:hypothetical protein
MSRYACSRPVDALSCRRRSGRRPLKRRALTLAPVSRSADDWHLASESQPAASLPFVAVRLAVRVPGRLISAGARGEKAVRQSVGRSASSLALAGLGALMDSRFAQEAVDRVVAGPLARRAVQDALAGELVETIGDDVARYQVIERIAAPLAESGALERIVLAGIANPVTADLANRVLESPAAEQVVARAIDGKLLEQAVDRLLESEDLWILVDEIARSPSVTSAIGHQSLGLADQFAEVVRNRSSNADERIAQAVERLRTRTKRHPHGHREQNAR